MFKLRNLCILCTKLTHFKCDACYRSQNSWNERTFTMVQHLSSFQNSLKMSGHRGYEFWCWNLVPFLPDIGFQAVEEFVVV